MAIATRGDHGVGSSIDMRKRFIAQAHIAIRFNGGPSYLTEETDRICVTIHNGNGAYFLFFTTFRSFEMLYRSWDVIVRAMLNIQPATVANHGDLYFDW